MRRLASVLPLILLLAAASAMPAAAEAAPASHPPTLSGEQFHQCWYTPDESCTGSRDRQGITARCNPDGSGTLTFATEGAVSAGPYPGRFEAAGTVTFAPGGEVTSLTEEFVIDSPNGHVVGTKTLASGGGECSEDYDHAVLEGATARYTAEISTPDGRVFRDRGTAKIHIYKNIRGIGSSFYQGFTSDFAYPLVCKEFKDKDGGDKDKCKDKERAAETRLAPPLEGGGSKPS